MSNYEVLKTMPAEEKKKLADSLRGAVTGEEAAKVLEAAGVTVTDGNVGECLQYLSGTSTPLSDEELAGVSGGGWYPDQRERNPENVVFVKEIGDIVEVSAVFGTVRCRIIDRRVAPCGFSGNNQSPDTVVFYGDQYNCVELEEHWYFTNGWKNGCDIEK